MSYNVDWFQQNRILLISDIRCLTVVGAKAALRREIIPMIESSNVPVHLVYDFHADVKVDFSIQDAMRSSLSQTFLQHPKTGYHICVTNSQDQLFRLYTSYLHSRLKIPAFVFSSVNESIAFLYRNDATLIDKTT